MTALAVLVAFVLLVTVVLLVHAAPTARSSRPRASGRCNPRTCERLWWPEPDVPVPRRRLPRTWTVPEQQHP